MGYIILFLIIIFFGYSHMTDPKYGNYNFGLTMLLIGISPLIFFIGMYIYENFFKKNSSQQIKSKGQKASSSKNKINKRRVYPSVFDIIGLKYMTRQKCGWCKSGHDARSKYEITTNEFPNQVFYSMDCYTAYANYYINNPKEKHKVDKKISLFGTSHHRLIGEKETSVKETSNEYPDSSEISGYPKDFIINCLIGKDFSINGKMCTMTHGKGSSQTTWVIKKGMWGEHVIQAQKLRKFELIDLYTQVYE